MNNKILVPILCVMFVVALVSIPIGIYNDLAAKQEDILNKSATIDVQLNRRLDLISNLVETVKGYAAHEQEVFANVSEARARLAGAVGNEAKAEANDEATAAIGRLIAIAEGYPEIKADANFRQLSDELTGTENRIAVARIDYNNAVTEYNKLFVTFPSNMIASLFGFEKAEYFEAAPGSTATPQVNFTGS